VALSAIARVQERFPQLRIVAFGSERPSPRLPLPPGAWFEHAPPQPRIRELYSQCDAWLTASRSEGFNLPAMEAMACGTPVVATRTGWPAEALIPGESGWLGDIDDVGGLAAGLKWVLTRPDSSWRELSRRAVRAATAGSWQQSSQQFERALLRACRRAQRGEIGGRPASAAMEPRLQASG
jgi:glycosyltransferase involved in cell wall biosynthesis